MPIVLTILSFCYYAGLSAKNYTWTFASGDSGSWLASAKMWFVPQAFGSPLYITLAKLVTNNDSTTLPIALTVFLSIIPATITILFIYIIVKKLTNNISIASLCALILLGSAVFLTQSTVVEEYTLATMFLTIAFYCFIINKKQLTALFLGLGLAVHIVILPIAILWFISQYKHWRKWTKTIPTFVATGILPYGLILWLMSTDAPRLFAGGLSWEAINSYLGGTYVVGSLALIETPERLGALIAFLLMSFGLSWIAVVKGFMKPRDNYIVLIIMTIAFPIWYYVTCLHSSTWTYLTFASPFLVIVAGIGLNRLNNKHFRAICIGTGILIILNTVLLNADKITTLNPVADEFLQEIMKVPDGSAVISTRYAHRGFATYYAYALEKDFVPIYYTAGNGGEEGELYLNYLEWIKKDFGLTGNNATELAISAKKQGRSIYIMQPRTELERLNSIFFDYNKNSGKYFYEVTDINEESYYKLTTH